MVNKIFVAAIFVSFFLISSQATLGSQQAQAPKSTLSDTIALNKKPALVLFLRRLPKEDHFGFIFDMSEVSQLQHEKTVKAIAIEKPYSKIVNPELRRVALLIKQLIKQPLSDEAGNKFYFSGSSCSMWATGQEGIEPIEVLPLPGKP